MDLIYYFIIFSEVMPKVFCQQLPFHALNMRPIWTRIYFSSCIERTVNVIPFLFVF